MTRFRTATDDIFQTLPFLALALSLLWSNRALKVGPVCAMTVVMMKLYNSLVCVAHGTRKILHVGRDYGAQGTGFDCCPVPTQFGWHL